MTTPDTAATVLVVDDELPIRSALGRFLRASGYHALEAESAEAALAQLRAHRVSGMLSDIIMPGVTGLELLSRAIAIDPDLAIIMLTGVGDPSTAIQCLKLGAADYLIKPVDLEELGLALTYALRKRQLEIDRRGLERWLAQEVASKTRALEEEQHRIEQLSLSVLGALVAALEPQGPHGLTHSVRVARLAGEIGARLGQGSDAVSTLVTAGRLHDIGRLGLRDDLLPDVGTNELVGARQDAAVADRLLEPLRHHAAVLEIIHCQHERWDGRGPLGLHGAAMIRAPSGIAAANLYDELVAPAEGAATGGLAPADALRNLQGLAGTLLDPEVLGVVGAAVSA